MPKLTESCRAERTGLAIRYRSQNPQVWQAAASAYLEYLTDDEILQVIAAKAKNIEPSDLEALYRCIPERALLAPAAQPLRNCRPFEEHLRLLNRMLEVEAVTRPVLDELTQRLNRETNLTKEALSYLQTIADHLPDELVQHPLKIVRRDVQEAPIALPFELRRFAAFEQYLEHLAGALEKNPNDHELFEEMILRIKNEKGIQLDNPSPSQRIVNTLSDTQALNFANLLYRRNSRLKIVLPQSCYFHASAELLRKRLNYNERWKLYDWGLSAGMALDRLECVLLKGDSKRARKFWSTRIDRIKLGTRLYDLAPVSIQDDVLRREYKIFLEEWKPRYESVEFEPNRLISSLNSDDKMLASIWADGRGKSSDIADRTMAIMLSARIAEKAAKRFYERLGHSVVDISIQQLRNTTAEWERYDLRLDDGTTIDIKNARFSKNGETNYVEHMIPRFKHDRYGKPVQIAGVVSPFLGIGKFRGQPYRKDMQTYFLGETNKLRVDEIENQFANATSNLTILELLSDRDPYPNTTRYHRLYPPWIFDYPDSFYAQRRKQLEVIQEMSDSAFPEASIMRRIGKHIPYALLLAAGRELPEQWETATLEWQTSLFTQLLKSGSHRSLPVLFLSILSDFITRIQNPPRRFRPCQYEEIVFFEEDRKKQVYPAGLYDPLRQVGALCQNLDTVWTKIGIERLGQFKTFKFRGLGILRGKDSMDCGKWKTLIAYCGGKTERKVACGNPNLVLGKDGIKSCPTCGYLICPKCNWCKWNCPEGEKRRPNFSEQPEDHMLPETDILF